MPFILIPLAYTGLNVLLREYAYREDVSKNNMGLANSFVSLSILGAAAGGAAGIFFNDDGFGKIIWGGLGAIIGFTAGVYIASIPQAQNAFRDNAYLYYSAPLIVGAAAAFPITLIWRD
ncbi:MAG: hypothetical protein LBD37_00260 [Treponema sp.]|nr:hypothetical protein [Treponema sp.]